MTMRLADFIAEHLDLILTRWHALARATAPPVAPEHDIGPRDHPAQMLKSICASMAAAQSGAATPSAPHAHATEGGALSPAARHGAERLLSGFTIEELVAEYHALRTSVLRLWVEHARPSLADEVDDIIRLNDAIDQAQAESVGRYATMLKHSQHLFLIRIHNSGKAIAPQALATIFDPLVRFADPRHAHGGADSSLGIGLYIARAIVEAHGGDIGAVSDERSGTTFTVRLPRVPPRAPVLAP